MLMGIEFFVNPNLYIKVPQNKKLKDEMMTSLWGFKRVQTIISNKYIKINKNYSKENI